VRFMWICQKNILADVRCDSATSWLAICLQTFGYKMHCISLFLGHSVIVSYLQNNLWMHFIVQMNILHYDVTHSSFIYNLMPRKIGSIEW